jgi:hypothetical protein
MNQLEIHTQIQSRYRAFDASGQLPFSIVFGFCRRSSADTDPRPLLLETSGSVLDVPFALGHGLLTLHEQDPDDVSHWVEVDLGRLSNVAPKERGECVSLPSPVNRTKHWRDAFTVHQSYINLDDDLASVLKPGKKYKIRLASEDLGVKRWSFSDQKQLAVDAVKPSHGSGEMRLVKSKITASNATFRVVKSLSWPPKTEVRMRLSAFASANLSNSATLEVSALNTGSHSVTIQTRGKQHFLFPWGPFEPEPDAFDHRPRIIDDKPNESPTSHLRVIDSATGENVRGTQPRRIAALTTSNADGRPKVENVITLKPGAPVIRKIDIGPLLDGLQDGKYKVYLDAKGCRWWDGEIKEDDCENGRVPAHLGEITIPPLMLESQDEVELRIKDGKVIRASEML